MNRIVNVSLRVVFLSLVAYPLRATAQSPCLPADSHTASLVGDFQVLVDTNTVADTGVRRTLGISAAPATSVYVVSDSVTCALARQALDSLIHAEAPSAPGLAHIPAIYVIAVGAAVAVDLPVNPNAQGRPVLFFNRTTWKFLGAVLLGG